MLAVVTHQLGPGTIIGLDRVRASNNLVLSLFLVLVGVSEAIPSPIGPVLTPLATRVATFSRIG